MENYNEIVQEIYDLFPDLFQDNELSDEERAVKDLLADMASDYDDNPPRAVMTSDGYAHQTPPPSDNHDNHIDTHNPDYKNSGLGKSIETDTLYNFIESINMELFQNDDGTFGIYDDVDNKIYANDLETPSDVVAALGVYNTILENIDGDIEDYYDQKANEFVDDAEALQETMEQRDEALSFSAEDWVVANTNSDFEDIIEEIRELQDVIILADSERLDKNASLSDIANTFDLDKSTIANTDKDKE